jgi:hypothetical protein
MKNWVLPIAVLSISSLGLLWANKRSREQLQTFFHRIANAEDPLGEFNQVVEQELDHIQQALDQLSEALGA